MIEFRPHEPDRPPVDSDGHLAGPPSSVRVIRELGHGRAARAQLVEATMGDGQVITCVEKVFAPGWLTRTIYRLSFQAPFAYQSHQEAILTCYYRRRVAAAVVSATNIEAAVASPIYVRFDPVDRAWVLAAEWIDGRGIRPAEADTTRIKRRFRKREDGAADSDKQPVASEVDQLVALMHQLESALGESGLVGSGWQVAPRALVSTANLLRTSDDSYTVIDLESGIPAVLVPRYILRGLTRGTLPPFDDLDAEMLREWYSSHQRLLTFRIGPEATERLRSDIESLINHSARWKESEFALFRRPWRHLTRSGISAYREECLRRWQQDGVVDAETARHLPTQPIKSRAIWWAGVLPSKLGRFCSKLIGHRDYRRSVAEYCTSRQVRDARWQKTRVEHRERWIASGRLAETHGELTKPSFLSHWVLSKFTPSGLHRLIADTSARRELAMVVVLLLLSPRYQSWFGRQRVETAITRWQDSQRISSEQADQLRTDLCGHEVLAYTRGFGMHLALKTLAPVVLPAKVGGVAAFLASGNAWFLLPMLLTPFLRTVVTLASAWTTRRRAIPHGEALLTGLLPVVGSVAFPLQMFSTRPKLSTFLIRDTASKLGRRLPIYGGADSRTEMAMIRATDLLIEVMETVANALRGRFGRRAADVRSESDVIPMSPRTRLGRWLDRHADQRISDTGHPSADGDLGVNEDQRRFSA